MGDSIELMKSIARRVRYAYPQWRYLRSASQGEPVTVMLPGKITARFHPWGQIARGVSVYGFESDELRLTASLLKEGMNVVDAGANVGLYSILASRRIGQTGHVWAFEPSSETYGFLLRNLKLNNADVVTACKMALGDRSDGTILLKRSPGRSDAERYVDLYPDHPSKRQADPSDPGDSERVSITSLDHYMQTNLSGRKIDFLKIDVEGCEYAVLQGARGVLKANTRLVLMFECSWQGCQWAGRTMDEVFGFLESLGFDLFCRDRRRNEWQTDRSALRAAGSIWACRDRSLLPEPV
jgi:FkbM family methyltransferase